MAVKPSNIFYVLRICGRPLYTDKLTDRQTANTHTNYQNMYTLWGRGRWCSNNHEKKNHVTTQQLRHHEGHISKLPAELLLLFPSLSLFRSLSFSLSGEIKTDQNVIFKSLNLYKIAARKPKRSTTKALAKQTAQRCLSVCLSCLTVEGVIAYNNNINTWFSLSLLFLVILLSLSVDHKTQWVDFFSWESVKTFCVCFKA